MFCGWWLCSLQQLSTIPGIKKFQCHYRWCDTRREQRNLLSTHDLSIWQLITFERSQIKVDNLQNNIVAIKCFHEMLVTWLTWLSNNSKSTYILVTNCSKFSLCSLQATVPTFSSVTVKTQGTELNKLQTLPFLNHKQLLINQSGHFPDIPRKATRPWTWFSTITQRCTHVSQVT